MKNAFFLLLAFNFLILSCDAFAGTSNLTTYFPAPTAAYNQIKLTLNAAQSNRTTTGALYEDKTGTLHYYNNGTDTVYPPQCLNLFCTCDTTLVGQSCAAQCPSFQPGMGINGFGGAGPCPTGFNRMMVDAQSSTPNTPSGYGDTVDTYLVTDHTEIFSVACCSGGVTTMNKAAYCYGTSYTGGCANLPQAVCLPANGCTFNVGNSTCGGSITNTNCNTLFTNNSNNMCSNAAGCAWGFQS